LPEKAGRAFYQAMMQAFHHREPRETVVFLDTIGVTFANHFWFVPVDADEVMAIMRQHPFQPTTSL